MFIANSYLNNVIVKIKIPMWMVILIIGSIIVYFIFQTWLVGICCVVGQSMEPTYHDGDYLIYKSYELLIREPVRGDVIIFSDKDGILVIKRVVRIPGEVDDISPGPRHTLKPGEFVVLGDNTKNSLDSRTYGTVSIKQMLGIVKQ